MFNNWSDLLPTVKKAFGALGKSNPKMVKAYMALGKQPRKMTSSMPRPAS